MNGWAISAIFVGALAIGVSSVYVGPKVNAALQDVRVITIEGHKYIVATTIHGVAICPATGDK